MPQNLDTEGHRKGFERAISRGPKVYEGSVLVPGLPIGPNGKQIRNGKTMIAGLVMGGEVEPSDVSDDDLGKREFDPADAWEKLAKVAGMEGLLLGVKKSAVLEFISDIREGRADHVPAMSLIVEVENQE